MGEAAPGGLTLRSITSINAALLPPMEIAQAQLRKVGIALELDVVDHPTYHAKIREDLSAPTLYGAWRFPVADS